MPEQKTLKGYKLISTDSHFNFTIDWLSGQVEFPAGSIPKGTILKYVRRTNWSDGTHHDENVSVTIP